MIFGRQVNSQMSCAHVGDKSYSCVFREIGTEVYVCLACAYHDGRACISMKLMKSRDMDVNSVLLIVTPSSDP